MRTKLLRSTGGIQLDCLQIGIELSHQIQCLSKHLFADTVTSMLFYQPEVVKPKLFGSVLVFVVIPCYAHKLASILHHKKILEVDSVWSERKQVFSLW